jgi:C4-dicarboxylate-binding protein DctP
MKQFFQAALGALCTVCIVSGCVNPALTRSKAKEVVREAVSVKSDARIIKPDYSIRLAYTDSADWPKSSKLPLPEHAAAIVFKSFVETNTAGGIAVELYPAAALGNAEKSLALVKAGRIEMTISTGAAAAIYPKLQVLNLPYVFRSDEIAWRVFDHSKFWRNLCDEFEESEGLKILGVGQNGTRHLSNSQRPIYTPQDLSGLRLTTTATPIYRKMFETLGASVIALENGEVYAACRDSLIDGAENPLWTIASNKLFEVQKFLTLDAHTWSEDLLIINAAFFASLPDEYRRVVRIAADYAQNTGRVAETLLSHVLDFQAIKDSMQVYEPTMEEISAFAAAFSPAYDWLRSEIGDATMDAFLTAIAEAEEYYGYRTPTPDFDETDDAEIFDGDSDKTAQALIQK